MTSKRKPDTVYASHEQDPEMTVWVRRDMRDWRKALYRLKDISGIRWDWVSGGLGFQAPGVFLYGYVSLVDSILSNRRWVKATDPDWNLLTVGDMRRLFPDAQIMIEWWMGLPKSIIACRR